MMMQRMNYAFLLVMCFVLASATSGQADLVHHWQIEGDSAGTLTDSVGGSNLLYDDPTEGALGAGAAAPGIGSSQGFGIITGGDATTAGAADLFQAGAFSFALWYQKQDDTGSAQPGIIGVIENGGSFQHNFLLRQASDAGNLNFFSRDVSGTVFNTASSVTMADNEWHHLAVTFDWSGTAGDSATSRVYVDGLETGTETQAAWDGWIAANQTQGGLGQETFTPSANFDDIRIYNNALSAGEVASLAATAVPEPGTAALLVFGMVGLVVRRRR